MIQIITNEKEIERIYQADVAEREGYIHLDMDDFYEFATKHEAAMAIIVDSPASVHDQIEIAKAEINKQGIEKVTAVILAISYKPESPLMMEEMNVGDLFDDGVNLKRGILERDDISNSRSVSLFIFAQRS